MCLTYNLPVINPKNMKKTIIPVAVLFSLMMMNGCMVPPENNSPDLSTDDQSTVETAKSVEAADSAETGKPEIVFEDTSSDLRGSIAIDDEVKIQNSINLQDDSANTDCVNLADLPNEYGCNPSMTCDVGQVCRDGLCVEEADAPNEYGCHPSMTCDAGQVCREGLCVDEADAPDAYGCNPSMTCDAGQVCRDGLCINICE